MTTPTALPTLTSQELYAVYGHATDNGLLAVQAAVHAKVLPYFAQREREAERAAWKNGYHIGKSCEIFREECGIYRSSLDNIYPKLAPTPSPEITLSSGWTFRRNAGKWEAKGLHGGSFLENLTVNCITLADVQAVASLLRLEEQ